MFAFSACSNIIPRRVSFETQYVKTYGGRGEYYKIIKSVSQLDDYIATMKQNAGIPDDYKWFEDDVIGKYNDEYFENSFIVIFTSWLPSGSLDIKVKNVIASRDIMIINYEIVTPPDGCCTDDMAYWYVFIELSNKYNTVKDVSLNYTMN